MKQILVLSVICFCIVLSAAQEIDLYIYTEPNDAIKAVASSNELNLIDSDETGELLDSFLEQLPEDSAESQKIVSDFIQSISDESIESFVASISDDQLNTLVKHTDLLSAEWILETQSLEGVDAFTKRLLPEQLEIMSRHFSSYIYNSEREQSSISDAQKQFYISAFDLQGIYLDSAFEGSFVYTAEGSFSVDARGNMIQGNPGLVVYGLIGREKMNVPLGHLEDKVLFFLEDGVQFDFSSPLDTSLDAPTPAHPSGPLVPSPASGSGGDLFPGYSLRSSVPSLYVGENLPSASYEGFAVDVSKSSDISFFGSTKQGVLSIETTNDFSYTYASPETYYEGVSHVSPLLFSSNEIYTPRYDSFVSLNERVFYSDNSIPSVDLSNPFEHFVYSLI